MEWVEEVDWETVHHQLWVVAAAAAAKLHHLGVAAAALAARKFPVQQLEASILVLSNSLWRTVND
jgi:hypothetical protein